MKCLKCGTEFEGKFCPACGNPAESVISETIAVAPPPQSAVSVQPSQLQEQQLRIQTEQLEIQRQQLAMQRHNEASKMVCPRCHSNNVSVQAVAEQKKRGCFMSLLWIVLAICTVGIVLLLIPLLTKKGSKTRTYAICQSCGYRWKV